MLDALPRAGDEWLVLGRRWGGGTAPAAAQGPLVEKGRCGRLAAASAALAGRPRLDRILGGGLDVVWAPAPRPLALSDGVPFVLTVHDLSFHHRPRDFTAYERVWHRIARPRRLAERATIVVVDSGATRDDVLERWRIDPARVRVIAPGVTRRADGALPPLRHGLRPGYLLCVGALEPRKDPQLLLRAHRTARLRGLLDRELVFAGEGRLAGRLRAPGVHVLGRVSDAELDALYSGAAALVMPSRLEGFGLPPLEALARGIPPVVADLPVYDETLGAGALRFPPGDEEALVDALARIVDDVALREQILAAGERAIDDLSWERAAGQLHAALREAAAA